MQRFNPAQLKFVVLKNEGMLQAATLKFLKDLDKNNNREWFDANRDRYDAARKDYEQFAAALMKAMIPIEPRLEEQLAKNTIFRIFRDVRFSKDKTPYKAHLSSYFSREGRKWEGAGYYLHIQPGNMFLASGIWMPAGPLLKATRQEIDYDFEGFEKILKEKSFKKYFGSIGGERLQKVPAGYEADNPAADYLKMKSFIASHKMSDDDVLKPDAVKKIAAIFSAVAPMVAFFNRAFD